jgi:hypothetical protein
MNPRTALVVTPDLAELERLAPWLEAAGFITAACAGPRLRGSCRRLEGSRCLLREAVDVAVVAMPPSTRATTVGEPPEASCTTVPDNGTSIFIDEAGMIGTRAGTLEHLGPLIERTLVEAVEDILSRDDRDAGPSPQVGFQSAQTGDRVAE